jgi:TfoX/Sxy family transcriptional regulator of competence genes
MPDRLSDFQSQILAGASSLPPDVDIEFRKMFGGMGAYARGRYFASTCTEGFALKFSPDECETRLKVKGALPLQHEPGVTSKGYVVVPQGVLADPAKLREWVEASIAYVQTLPLPKRKR